MGRWPIVPALCASALIAGCDNHGSATRRAHEGVVPATTALVYLATTLPCKDVSHQARFTPLVVRGRGYATTLDPLDDCRKQQGQWHSYVYEVPVAESGDVQLTPGNQPTAILNTSKLKANHSATIYYVNCADYYSKCPEAAGFDGRISSIEYFKDEDVANTPP